MTPSGSFSVPASAPASASGSALTGNSTLAPVLIAVISSLLNPALDNILTIDPESVGSPAFCQSLLSLLAVTLFPTSFMPCLAPATALPATPLAHLPAAPNPLFAFAPSVLGSSNPKSICAPFCWLGSAYLGSSIHALSGPTSANLLCRSRLYASAGSSKGSSIWSPFLGCPALTASLLKSFACCVAP